ncbi:dual oxidase maturation factor 1-like [Ptychodera flava]|uniref:dual oxidase maturation factor 1-like n=1 Tax=Ptychodera flava TaxID=63121 RepID=UPI003969BC5F
MLDELFTAFRHGDAPTLYGENRTAVSADILEAGLIFCTCIIATAYLLILPGIRGRKRIYGAVRGLLAIYIGAIILIANFGQEWEVSEIHTKTEYKAATDKDIEAEVGVKIGLRSVNITLKGTPEKQLNEQINYNERFSWAPTWDQGRLFYGPWGGQVNQEFRAAQYRGLPYPILWIAEYFTIDGENLRWGRSYRMSGYYAHILLWTAFPTWIIANILLFMVINYAAYCMILTGIWMLLANLMYWILRWGPMLRIPFADGVLDFHFGWSFWITFATGIICLVYGSTVLVCNKLWPEKVADFFEDYDKPLRKRDKKRRQLDEIERDLDSSTTTLEMTNFNGETGSLGYESRHSRSPSLNSGHRVGPQFTDVSPRPRKSESPYRYEYFGFK